DKDEDGGDSDGGDGSDEEFSSKKKKKSKKKSGSRSRSRTRSPSAARGGGKGRKKRLQLVTVSDDVKEQLAQVKDEVMDEKSKKVDVSCCPRCSSRECLRAVLIEDTKLLENVVKDQTHVADPLISCSHNSEDGAIYEALRRGQTTSIKKLFQYMKSKL